MGILQQLRLSLPQEGYLNPKMAPKAGPETLESIRGRGARKFRRSSRKIPE